MTNTYGAAWEVPNAPALPISLEVTSGSQTVSHPLNGFQDVQQPEERPALPCPALPCPALPCPALCP